MIRAVLAVDSGGSGTRVRHSASSEVVELPGITWTSGDVVSELAKRVGDAWHRLGEPTTDLVALGVAATPATAADVDALARPVSATTGAAEVVVANDARAAHLGGLGGEWGVALTVGTGVACLGIGSDHRREVTVDGYGYLVGDLGAAFWIGRQAVRAVLDAATIGGTPTALTGPVVEQLGPIDGLAYRLHGRGTAVAELAALAPSVVALIEQDQVATRIAERATRHLADTAISAAAALAEPDAVPLVLGGGVLPAEGRLTQRVTRLVEEGPTPIVVRPAVGTPLDGVARLATAPASPGIRRWTRGAPS